MIFEGIQYGELTPEEDEQLKQLNKKLDKVFKMSKTPEQQINAYKSLSKELNIFFNNFKLSQFNKINGNENELLNYIEDVTEQLINRYIKEYPFDLNDDILKTWFKNGVMVEKDGKYLYKIKELVDEINDILDIFLVGLADNRDKFKKYETFLKDKAIDSGVFDVPKNFQFRIKKPTQKNHSHNKFISLPGLKTYGIMNHEISQRLHSWDLMDTSKNKELAAVLQDEGFITSIFGLTAERNPQYTMFQTTSGSLLACLQTDGQEKIRLDKKDQVIIQNIGSLEHRFKECNPNEYLYFTAYDVWRVGKGLQTDDNKEKYSQRPSPGELKDIERRLAKMSRIRIYLHYLNEEVEGGVAPIFLNITPEWTINEKGKQDFRFKLIETPFIYKFNESKGKLLIVNYNLLRNPNITYSDKSALFRDYLLQEITRMKKGKRDEEKILLKTLYNYTGVATPDQVVLKKEISFKTEHNDKNAELYKNIKSRQAVIRRLRKSDLDIIRKLLDGWKTQLDENGDSFIKDYEIFNDKGLIEIKFNEKEPKKKKSQKK